MIASLPNAYCTTGQNTEEGGNLVSCRFDNEDDKDEFEGDKLDVVVVELIWY